MKASSRCPIGFAVRLVTSAMWQMGALTSSIQSKGHRNAAKVKYVPTMLAFFKSERKKTSEDRINQNHR